MRNSRLMAAVLIGLFISLHTGVTHADKKKPQPQPSESITLNFTKIVVTYQIQGPNGPSVGLDGQLHLVSQTFIADDGTPVAFTLHGNLGDTSALSVDGAQPFQAVDGLAIECVRSRRKRAST